MYNAYIAVDDGGILLGRAKLEQLVDADARMTGRLWVGSHLRRPVLRIEARWADDFRRAYWPALEAIRDHGYRPMPELNSAARRLRRY